ncbi:ABC transporter permease [Pseudolysinimonas yzui]|uniref:Sugar ABC transporter permease n=1 Tax=Pseudolysinimonas yzui TaxID=2708254 RepID=A0A8J3GSN0_9MICO|nr:ABC transporter permease [Pseudolysinimonas yzui]GHF22855.1 sugar ABC transporter permease [Pseudolysinimonas yzui]
MSDSRTIPGPAELAQSPAVGTASEAARARLVGTMLWLLRLGPFLILVIMIAVLAGLSPVFFTPGNLGNVLTQSAAIAILAMGQLLVILTRGIDLSVGSTLALAAVVGALVYAETDSGFTTILAMVFTGALVGAVNGFGYVYGRLPHPFIVTLATLSIARGLALGLSGGQPVSGMPEVVTTIGGGSAAWLASWFPNAAFLVAGVAILVTLMLRNLVWGRWIYAVGGSPEGARRLGVPRNGVIVSVYIMSGLLAGVAAIVTAGRLNAGSPTFGQLAELDAIAAVVIGGASFLGGRGNVGNALIGALMIGVIRNGMNLLNVEGFLQLIVIGVVIVIAVESDVIRTRLEARFRVLKAASA